MYHDLTIPGWLLTNAIDESRGAIDGYIDGEPERFAVRGGSAIEFAAKHVLAEVNPVFIAADWHSSLTLHRHWEDVFSIPLDVRTIGCAVALDRVESIRVGVRRHRKALDRIRTMRNSEVHLSVGGSYVEDFDLAEFAVAMEMLLEIDDEALWGERSAEVKDLSEGARAARQRSANEAMAAAATRWAELQRDLSSEILEGRIGAARWRQNHDVDQLGTAEVTCPVCGSPSIASGVTTSVGDHVIEDGEDVQVYPALTFFADGLRCFVCRLELRGQAALQEAGIASDWDLTAEAMSPWMELEVGRNHQMFIQFDHSGDEAMS